MPEVTVGSLVFEYDPITRYLGIGDGHNLFGTAEITVEDWETFVDASADRGAPAADDTLARRITLFSCPSPSCRYVANEPGQCRSHPYPCRAMGPQLQHVEVVVKPIEEAKDV